MKRLTAIAPIWEGSDAKRALSLHSLKWTLKTSAENFRAGDPDWEIVCAFGRFQHTGRARVLL
jgi:hypothetical protein